MKRDQPNRAHQGTVPEPPTSGRNDPQLEWDEKRSRCPVCSEVRADGTREWVVYGHAEALSVLEDHDTFSSRVSTHLSVPSGMDPPDHTKFREIVNRYFTPGDMAAFEPVCRKIAAKAVAGVVSRGGGEAQSDLGEPCAVRMQCAYMGWPASMLDELTAWQEANARATRAGDKAATAAVAKVFERKVSEVLEERRALGDEAPDDRTTRLLEERVDGRPLTDEELVSIIRNWTVGELGSIAAGIGILVHELAADRELQTRLRQRPELIALATDEVLRVRNPLIANRRLAARDSQVGGQRIAGGDRLRVVWPALNRDERVFEEPERVDLERDQSQNLLYGTGIHYCPGAPLARLELRVFVEELLKASGDLWLDHARPAEYAAPPKGGFETVYFGIER